LAIFSSLGFDLQNCKKKFDAKNIQNVYALLQAFGLKRLPSFITPDYFRDEAVLRQFSPEVLSE